MHRARRLQVILSERRPMTDPRDLDTGELPALDFDLELPPPISSGVRIDVAALSHIGKVREHNEDHYLVASGARHATTLLTNVPPGDVPSEFGETSYLMIVADGMGGHAAGEVASRMAIATLINIILHVPDWILRLDDEHAQKVMERAVMRCPPGPRSAPGEGPSRPATSRDGHNDDRRLQPGGRFVHHTGGRLAGLSVPGREAPAAHPRPDPRPDARRQRSDQPAGRRPPSAPSTFSRARSGRRRKTSTRSSSA